MESPQSAYMDEPAIYQICVDGLLADSLANSFWGLSCTQGIRDDQSISVLKGRMIDQAALLGVINALYNMGYAVLSIELISPDGEE